MKNKVFIDTSILIYYFRRNNYSADEAIEALIINDEVFINGIVITEIIAGTKRNESSIIDNIDFLNILEMDNNFFIQAGKMIKKIKGATIPLSDIYIACHCLIHDLELWGNDKHF
jgi:predicted nucleic acid-binding protein